MQTIQKIDMVAKVACILLIIILNIKLTIKERKNQKQIDELLKSKQLKASPEVA